MAQPIAPYVHWLEEAWLISDVLAALPETLPGEGRPKLNALQRAVAGSAPTPELPPLESGAQACMVDLQKSIANHLHYQMIVNLKNPGGVTQLAVPLLNKGKPSATRKAREYYRTHVAVPKSSDLWAFDAHLKLGQIMTSKGKGSNMRESPIGFPVRQSPIGAQDAPKVETLSCVGIARKPAVPALLKPSPVPTAHDDDRVVDRSDADFADWRDEGQTEPGAWQ